MVELTWKQNGVVDTPGRFNVVVESAALDVEQYQPYMRLFYKGMYPGLIPSTVIILSLTLADRYSTCTETIRELVVAPEQDYSHLIKVRRFWVSNPVGFVEPFGEFDLAIDLEIPKRYFLKRPLINKEPKEYPPLHMVA